MNTFWDVAVDELLRGELDMLDQPLVIAPYEHFWFDAAQTDVSDLQDSLCPPLPLVNRSVGGRTLYADDVLFPSVALHAKIERFVIWRETDGLLVVYIDTRPDRMPVYVRGNGGPIEVVWNQRAVISL